jgi:hypothetical protein
LLLSPFLFIHAQLFFLVAACSTLVVFISWLVREIHTDVDKAHAIHLAKLIPYNASTQPPSIATISDFLLRAKLPIEVLAFTACILDALSHRFASSWRASNLPSTSTPFKYIPLHIGSRPLGPVRSEVIVLAALSLAHGWLEDRPRSNSHWACITGASKFTSGQVEIARRCILQDVDYGLFRITQDMVRFMTEEMQRAESVSLPCAGKVGVIGKKTEDKRPKLSLDTPGTGTAVWTFGMITPEPSP